MGYWNGRRVFVTGGDGFIGANLVRELLKLNAEVAVLTEGVDFSKPFWRAWDDGYANCRTYNGDIRDVSLLSYALTEWQPEIIFHLAAMTQAPFGGFNVRRFMDVNIMGAVTLFEACAHLGNCPSIIFATTDKVYGRQSEPAKESTPFNPGDPYDTSKMCADLIAQSFQKKLGWPITIVRTCNVYGPGDTNWERLIPGALRSMVLDRPFRVRSNGRFVREYAYVDDVVRAYLRLAYEKFGGVFNVSWGHAHSVLEIVEACRLVADRSEDWARLNISIAATADENPYLRLDSSKFLRYVGGPTNLVTGLARTHKWMVKYVSY